MTLSSLELMSLDTPCKPRKPSWSGVCSSESALTSPSHTSYALPPPTPPAKTENKSQLTGLVEQATWFQRWTWEEMRKPKVMVKPLSEHNHDDRQHPSISIQFLLEFIVLEKLYIDIFRIYFRSPLLEL